jgi:hypothetical protein
MRNLEEEKKYDDRMEIGESKKKKLFIFLSNRIFKHKFTRKNKSRNFIT